MKLKRIQEATVLQRLGQSPAVVLLGPRQVGKTTLAHQVATRFPGAVLLDMERESDRAALSQPELYLATVRDRLVVLDEVQQVPELFRALRPEIDALRRPGRFLLLGSASGELLRQSSESLAGRASYVELTPLLAAELPPVNGCQEALFSGCEGAVLEFGLDGRRRHPCLAARGRPGTGARSVGW